MDTIVTHAREILAELAPEIDPQEITLDGPLASLELDEVTRFALVAGLERAMKVEIPDERACTASTLGDLLGDDEPRL